MTADEFRLIAADMQGRWWAFEIPAAALAQYVLDLGDLSAGKVASAIEALSTDGLDRPPTSGQIRRRVAEMELDAPDWSDVRIALVRWRQDRPARLERAAAWACPAKLCDGDGFIIDKAACTSRPCPCREDYVRALRGLDVLPPLVAEWMEDGHVAMSELEHFLDEGNTTREAQLRVRWREFAGRAVQSRTFAGLQDRGELPRLAAARAEDEDRDDRHHRAPRRIGGDRGMAGLLERGTA